MQKAPTRSYDLEKNAIAYLDAFHDISVDRSLLGVGLFEAANEAGKAAGWFDFKYYFSWDDDAYDVALSFSEKQFNRIKDAKDDQDLLLFRSFALVHLMIQYAAYRDMDEDAQQVALRGVLIYARERNLERRRVQNVR